MTKKIGKVLTGEPNDKDSYPLPTYVTYNNFDKPLSTEMKGVCATYMGLKIRPEMEAALNEVVGKDFAFAVVRSYDDEAWQVLIKKKNITRLEPTRYFNRDDAVNAGVIHLANQEKSKLTAIEPPPLAVTNKSLELADLNLLATMGLIHSVPLKKEPY